MVEKNKKTQAASRSRLFEKRGIIKLIVMLGLLIFVASFVAWVLLVRNQPKNVFEGMLKNNFRTTSVTRVVKQDAGYRQLEQVMRIQSGSQHITHGVTKLSQAGGSTTITTESIGLPDVEYIRYVDIQTSQKNSKGEELDFSESLNVWAENKPSSEDQLSGLYQDVTLGNAFLFADFNKSTRDSMLATVNDTKVYDVDYNDVQKTWRDGRLKYTYKMKLNPKAYITMLKQYGQAVGLTQLENLDPEAYGDAQPIEFQVVVDVLSQRLDAAKSSNGSTDQTFSGYGIIENVEVPTEFIQAEELQERLSQSAGV